jgi:hypothetical protein
VADITRIADNLIDAAIDKGYREAQGAGRRRFRKELGEPVLWDLQGGGDGAVTPR